MLLFGWVRPERNIENLGCYKWMRDNVPVGHTSAKLSDLGELNKKNN